MIPHEARPDAGWTVADSVAAYHIDRWGQGLFGVDPNGHLCLRADDGGAEIDLYELVADVRMRGLQLPVLIRFEDILRRRLDELASAFRHAAQTHGYRGEYRGVYPIKVNQHRHVLADMISLGRPHHLGLEAGSKAELLVAIAMLSDPDALVICNGFKDRDYVETAMAGRKLGQTVILVIEKPAELPFVVQVARELRVAPVIGVRIKLSSSGGGKWASSSGDHSKFGLRPAEVVDMVRTLRRRKMLDRLQLLHFHLGSQVSDIRWVKDALREATAVFAELCRMGAPIRYVDVGGGLAVDYDGSHTSFESSANYTIHEYASDVVEALRDACEEARLPHPTIVSESGRALTAHHAVLVVEAIAAETSPADLEVPPPPRRAPPLVQAMGRLAAGLSADNVQTTYHRAAQVRREAFARFTMRQLSLEHHAHVDRQFRVLCHRISTLVDGLPYVPDELAELTAQLAVTYTCNFSLFQSLPDHWAVDQLFPVLPLHRLDERPTMQGVLADITCDSDGAMRRFVDLEDVRSTLPLHPMRAGEPYVLGIFLVGAYQEVLGDLHNLFGDTHVVHVSSGRDGYVIEKTVEGDSIVDVLGYLQYNRRQLLGALRRRVESALRRGAMALSDSAALMRDLESRLDDYTYLQPPPPPLPRRRRPAR